MAVVLGRHGIAEEELNEITKVRFGSTYSKVAEGDLITVLDELWHKEPMALVDEPEAEETGGASYKDFQKQANEFGKKLKYSKKDTEEFLHDNFPGVKTYQDLTPEQREAALHKLADLVSMKG